MGIYYLIFINSFKSSVILSLYSENAWFAALLFGGYHMLFASLMAVLGSTAGTSIAFFAGAYLASKRGELFVFKESIYQRIAKYRNYLMLLLVVPFYSIPVVGAFWSSYVLLTGFFGAPILRALTLIMIGRVIYYGFYLLQ